MKTLAEKLTQSDKDALVRAMDAIQKAYDHAENNSFAGWLQLIGQHERAPDAAIIGHQFNGVRAFTALIVEAVNNG